MQQALLTEEDQKQIIEAIGAAEMATSGEVRVHIEKHCPTPDPLERAKQVFYQLGMQHTDQKNGVLIYLALTDRKFAILGDSGINERVPANFWDSERDLMKSYFIKNQIAQGLAAGIEQVGQQLKAYFPRRDDDQNELSDDISFG